MPISNYGGVSDSVSLAKIGDKAFTMVDIEDSAYTQGTESTPGVKITTKEEFEIDGATYNKFHTTRIALVTKLTDENLRSDIKNGSFNTPVKCVSITGKNGKNYFDLVDV